ncbi:MAG: isoaspartyl peptidase/L-asparaginase [Steroidobacteraceae bacterium]|nr:isoaspartyl peptidase/L-asparaginase [Steroidobacteraceae bacterium]
MGAGTYANAQVAVSATGDRRPATGDGEYFIRAGAAKDLAARVEYARQSLADAARATIGTVGELGGSGGVIALDARGTVVFEFNSPGMFRGTKRAQASEVAIWR